ncbi:MAG: RNA polymerase sigma factor [Pseudonocardiaceae bacterium]
MTTIALPTPTSTWTGHGTDLADLVAGAKAGRAACWREIVDWFDGRLRRAASARGLDGPTAADVVQQTWLAAVVNIDALRDPQALGGWLHRILHHECLKAIRLRRRETPCIDDTDQTEVMSNGRTAMMCTELRTPEEEALRVEQRMLIQMARRRLPRRDQDLLNLLAAEPRLPYTEISRRLGVPTGSIGPTRARCFAKLRRELAALGVHG